MKCEPPGICSQQAYSRAIRGLLMGNKKVDFHVPIYRINDCPTCGKSSRAVLPFVDRYARHTRAVDRSVVEMRQTMSIKAVAAFFGLDWRAVKDIEKKYLGRKFRRIRLRNVKIIGIDENMLFINEYRNCRRGKRTHLLQTQRKANELQALS